MTRRKRARSASAPPQPPIPFQLGVYTPADWLRGGETLVDYETARATYARWQQAATDWNQRWIGHPPPTSPPPGDEPIDCSKF